MVMCKAFASSNDLRKSRHLRSLCDGVSGVPVGDLSFARRRDGCTRGQSNRGETDVHLVASRHFLDGSQRVTTPTSSLMAGDQSLMLTPAAPIRQTALPDSPWGSSHSPEVPSRAWKFSGSKSMTNS